MRATIFSTIVWVTGCASGPIPTAPTAVAEPRIEAPKPVLTSRVNPSDYDLSDYWLEHDPNAPGVQLCRTKQREYCQADGSTCSWSIDLYTVVSPDVCPLEPIE